MACNLAISTYPWHSTLISDVVDRSPSSAGHLNDIKYTGVQLGVTAILGCHKRLRMCNFVASCNQRNLLMWIGDEWSCCYDFTSVHMFITFFLSYLFHHCIMILVLLLFLIPFPYEFYPFSWYMSYPLYRLAQPWRLFFKDHWCWLHQLIKVGDAVYQIKQQITVIRLDLHINHTVDNSSGH